MRITLLVLGLAACGGGAFTPFDGAGDGGDPTPEASAYVDAAADSPAEVAPGIALEASDDLGAVPEASPEAAPAPFTCELTCKCSPSYPARYCFADGVCGCRACRFPVDDAGCHDGCTCGG